MDTLQRALEVSLKNKEMREVLKENKPSSYYIERATLCMEKRMYDADSRLRNLKKQVHDIEMRKLHAKASNVISIAS